ncbi:Hypothetical protein SCLAV_1963 [Streptomyces clavuligerus]|uniref:Uncharacterized protein n=4 Tax=Streptomyces clavuligerus TaxID=1901 RepID=E2Q4J8_STRCL|nr:Hypothetical protein SCLAV_1963 [Streptomyces clavuligerus]
MEVGMETSVGGVRTTPAARAMTRAPRTTAVTALSVPAPRPATQPTTARRLPTPDSSAPPAGWRPGRCDLVTVPTRQGLEAVDILRRTTAAPMGPVLHDGPHDTLAFLVPPGTADAWDLPGSACTRTRGGGARPLTEPPVRGCGWLLPPGEGEAGRVTDPVVLRRALGEAARLIEAADNHR